MKRSQWMTALALLASFTAMAQPRVTPEPRSSPNPAVRILRVEGTGEAKAEPDEAWVDLAVETQGSTAKAAGEENARKMERVIAALTGAGIPRKEIDTRNYSVYPEYSQPAPSMEPKLRGYIANNTVSVHVRELPRLGDLIDRAIAAGANRVNGVRFALSKEDAVYAEALRQAVERGRKTAEVLSAALGVRLGAVLEVSTVSEPPHIYPARMAMMEAGDKSRAPTTPILPEEQTVQAQVTLIYAIEATR